MLAASAVKLAQKDTFAKRLKATHKSVLNAIKISAQYGGFSITIPAEKAWTPAERQQLYALLKKDGYRVEEKTLPDSKIEPNRLITTITWAA